MRFTFRAKLLAIAGITAFAFVVLILAEALLNNRMEHELGTIQEHYIPLIEFGPRLEAGFEHIGRSFQDSVASQDLESLERTREQKAAFLAELAAAGKVVDPVQERALQDSVEEYYTSAYAISRRLIAGETGVTLVSAIGLMQVKQTRVETLLKAALTLDRGKLVEAFFGDL